ncbi:MAG: carbamoyltransferase HypF [Candidatus Methanoplasma sp.]|jgi:hydrogenase maturation protein HypF|nr:carbamoyltransferase HypF [Candidatus Methanoplasma sp.]
MRIVFRGTVQGVGFRPAAYRAAASAGLRGRVFNEGSAAVVETDDADAFLKAFSREAPPLASIESVDVEEGGASGFDGFSIAPSRAASGRSSIPPDTAVCADCLADMAGGRRRGYPFTTCTSCGPRFTLLTGMPYDRANTSMRGFPPCAECGREYGDPSDRRFHHQTVCCPACGPSLRLLDGGGAEIPGDPVRRFADMLSGGGIGVVKGWGGMHICCSLRSVPRLREWYGRREKPFAVMARDMDAALGYGAPDSSEAEQMLSPQRPIVLVRKLRSALTEAVSPGLDNIGLFLPYAGVQHLLFEALGDDALVMTSANPPGEPMAVDDADAMRLGADAYLLHDQPIAGRADDSVLRMFEGRTFFIRRSRGHVPFRLETPMRGCAVGLGAQENLSGAVASDGAIHPTQHIGDGDGCGAMEYLEGSVRSLLGSLGCEPQAVAVDLHPGFSNRGLARRISEESGAETVEVQHHWAHAASLMADEGMGADGEIVCLALDGNGYGPDGSSWGGEALRADLSSFDRVAHLEGIPLLGGEAAARDIRRLKLAIDLMNGEENPDFPDREADVLSKMMGKSVRSSSMGRLMDALSYALGACPARTYDGEPAMRLEPLLARGRLVPGFEAETKGGVIGTAALFARIGGEDPADAAYSIVHSVASELVGAASDMADSLGMKRIGVTGGSSYCAPLCRMISDLAAERGHGLIFHMDVPNGDGGISVGQAAVALRLIS